MVFVCCLVKVGKLSTMLKLCVSDINWQVMRIWCWICVKYEPGGIFTKNLNLLIPSWRGHLGGENIFIIICFDKNIICLGFLSSWTLSSSLRTRDNRSWNRWLSRLKSFSIESFSRLSESEIQSWWFTKTTKNWQ